MKIDWMLLAFVLFAASVGLIVADHAMKRRQASIEKLVPIPDPMFTRGETCSE
jgi:hypothetical protein